MSSATLPRFDLNGWNGADIADPYPVYRRYRETRSVHYGASNTFYVFSYNEVVRVLTNRRFGRNARVASGKATATPVSIPAEHRALRTIVENWLVFMDPPRHTELRSLLNLEFSPTIVTGLRPRIEQIARDLVARLRSQREADLVENFAAPLPVLVISELLGVPEEDHEWLRTNACALQGASTTRSGNGGHARAEAAAQELTHYFRREVDRRRGNERNDLITLLATARVSGAPLTVDEIVGTCVHLITAGHETTTNTLTKAVLALRAHPKVLEELRATPRLMPGAVEEFTRFDPPVQAVTRWAYDDTVLNGLTIPRGSRVVALLGSANRDPARFRNPDVLDVHRRPGRHLGFGVGIHYCLGATLARAEVEIGLRALLDGIPELDRGGQEVVYADDMVFHGPARLVLGTASTSTLERRP